MLLSWAPCIILLMLIKQERKSQTWWNITMKPKVVQMYLTMCHSFSCNRKTRRWPMVLFYNLLDTATVASHIIYRMSQKRWHPLFLWLFQNEQRKEVEICTQVTSAYVTGMCKILEKMIETHWNGATKCKGSIFLQSYGASPFLSRACVFLPKPYWALLKAFFSIRQLMTSHGNNLIYKEINFIVQDTLHLPWHRGQT